MRRPLFSSRLSPWALGSLALLLGACGSPSAESSHRTVTPETPAVPIGDLAATRGGLRSLGGDREADGVSPTFPSAVLRATPIAGGTPVKLDGMLREWGALAGTRLEASDGNGAIALRGGFFYDANHVYLGGEIVDDSLRRSRNLSTKESHLLLTVACPEGGRWHTTTLVIVPGKPGEFAGTVRFASGKSVPKARVLEAATDHGLAFEVEIPWRALVDNKDLRVGLRANLVYVEAERSGRSRRKLALGVGEESAPTTLSPWLLGPEQAVLDGLLAQRGLDYSRPRADLLGDFSGDGQRERVTVFDSLFTVTGPGFRKGQEFFYRELNGEVLRVEERDVTGDGKVELLLYLQTRDGAMTREHLQIWSVQENDQPSMVFDHALSFQGEGKKLTNEWVLTSPRTIEIRQGAVTGWTRESYRDPSSGEGQPLLLPWGGVKTSKYVFDGHHFEPSPETRAALAASPLPGHAGPSTGTSASPSGGVPLSPLPPVLKKGGDLSAEVLAQFRQDHQVAVEVIPKADFQTNLAEDARLERVVLLGKDLVVCGPGFLGGRSYVFAGTPFADAEDIQSVTAMDFAGNGTFQLIVRGVRHTPMKGSTEAAHTDLMVIYAFQGTTLERVLTVETGREWGKKRIQGLAQFIPLGPGRGVELDVQAGRANGWTASTYPWTPSDVDNTDNLVPLLLPWGSVKSMRYAWSGSHFVRK